MSSLVTQQLCVLTKEVTLLLWRKAEDELGGNRSPLAVTSGKAKSDTA